VLTLATDQAVPFHPLFFYHHYSHSQVVGQLLGGNGGFSMRDYKLSMQCANEFAPSSGDEAEDNFFPKFDPSS
jgi:hypothetical protein